MLAFQAFILLLGTLAGVAKLHGQASELSQNAQIRVYAGGLRYGYVAHKDWRSSGAFQLRSGAFDLGHINVVYTRAATRFRRVCYPSHGCYGPTDAPLQLVVGGVGLSPALGRWRPFGGLSGGFLWQRAGGLWGGEPTWGWYLGVERGFRGRVRAGIEYRANRGEKEDPDRNHKWIHQIGLGAGLAFSPPAGLRRFVLKPEMIFGTAMGTAHTLVPVGGFGITGQSPTGPWVKSIGYRWMGILRTCEGPHEEPCSLETSGGHAFLMGLSRIFSGDGPIRRTAGVEMGVAHLAEYTGHSWGTYPTFSFRGGLQVPMSFGSMDLGGLFQWMPAAMILGLTAGLSVHP